MANNSQNHQYFATAGLLFTVIFVLALTACQDNDENPVVIESRQRIECERRAAPCNGRDAMRFYRSVPRISMAPDGSMQVTEVWYSFLVCCESFQPMMDSLTLYNDILTEAMQEGRSFERKCMIDSMVQVSVEVEWINMWSGKRYEWLNFGDSTRPWPMPVGEHFEEYKQQLEEAHARCCLL